MTSPYFYSGKIKSSKQLSAQRNSIADDVASDVNIKAEAGYTSCLTAFSRPKTLYKEWWKVSDLQSMPYESPSLNSRISTLAHTIESITVDHLLFTKPNLRGPKSSFYPSLSATLTPKKPQTIQSEVPPPSEYETQEAVHASYSQNSHKETLSPHNPIKEAKLLSLLMQPFFALLDFIVRMFTVNKTKAKQSVTTFPVDAFNLEFPAPEFSAKGFLASEGSATGFFSSGLPPAGGSSSSAFSFSPFTAQEAHASCFGPPGFGFHDSPLPPSYFEGYSSGVNFSSAEFRAPEFFAPEFLDSDYYKTSDYNTSFSLKSHTSGFMDNGFGSYKAPEFTYHEEHYAKSSIFSGTLFENLFSGRDIHSRHAHFGESRFFHSEYKESSFAYREYKESSFSFPEYRNSDSHRSHLDY